MLVSLILMQSAALALPPVAFDLRDLEGKGSCKPAQGDEILVCARPDQTIRHRLPQLPEAETEELLPKAEFGIAGDIKGVVEGEAYGLPGGVQSNRIMVRMKVPF